MWLELIRLILDIIGRISVDNEVVATSEDYVAQVVTEEVEARQNAAQDAGIPGQNWEELIPHIIAIIKWMLNRR